MADNARFPSTAPMWLLAGVFITLTWPVILFGGDATSEAFDQRTFHQPVIDAFARQWPRLDFTNYDSATAPGYHVLLALVKRFVSDNVILLRLLSSLFGLGFVMAAARYATPCANPVRAISLALPLACSSYVLGASIWLTTDNLAWLLVALALGGVCMRAASPAVVARSSLLTAAAVFVRQLHIWLVAPIAISAMASRRGPTSKRSIATLWLGLPIALLAWLLWLWGGLTPPAFAAQHAGGFNLAALPMTLALCGAFGVFFLVSIPDRNLRSVLRDPLVLAAAALAFILALAIPTSFDRDAGRWGGAIWTLVQRTPPIADRSLLMLALATLGGGVLAALWRGTDDAGRGRTGTLLLLAFVAWLAAQSANAQAWQRYAEPMVLLTLAWLTACAEPRQRSGPPLHPLMRAAPIALAILQLLAAIVALYRPAFS